MHLRVERAIWIEVLTRPIWAETEYSIDVSGYCNKNRDQTQTKNDIQTDLLAEIGEP